MNRIKIKYCNGFTRIWIDDVELESVQKCVLDLNAKRIPVAKLEMQIDECNVEQNIDEINVKIARE